MINFFEKKYKIILDMKLIIDFTDIWLLQKELDDKILQAYNLTKDQVYKKRKLALLVEIAEFSNEVKAFKYWSYKKMSNKDIRLEEFSDILHFLISIALYEENPNPKMSFIIKTNIDPIDTTIELMSIISLSKKNDHWINKAFIKIFELANYYEFTISEIKHAYIKKNKINLNRINNY